LLARFSTFAASRVNYRGIHLIFVVAGLIAMRRAADNPATGALLAWALLGAWRRS